MVCAQHEQVPKALHGFQWVMRQLTLSKCLCSLKRARSIASISYTLQMNTAGLSTVSPTYNGASALA